jgi:uncharacterized membrane protein
MHALDQPVTAHQLRQLRRAGILDAQAYERALALAGITPDGMAWRRFLDWLLAGLGATLVLSGIIFFFAYNWADMHRFAKFALLEVTLLIAVALAWRLGPDSNGGRAALIGAAVLPGVLLALHGQTYQTGADPYGLFLTWALLIAPWVLIGRSAALWLLWLVLANLSLLLWWIGVYRPPEWLDFAQALMPLFGLGFAFADADLALLVVMLNIAALLVHESLTNRITWLSGRWMPRLVMLGILATLIVPVMRAIFEPDPEMLSVRMAPLIWLGITALGVWVYRNRRHDLFMLAALSLEAIAVITAFLAEGMGFNDAGGMLSVSLLVVLMTGAVTYWLRMTARGWESEL